MAWTVSKSAVSELFTMLSTMRPHDSKTEEQFITDYLCPLEVLRDNYGNIHKTVGHSEVVWSCHTDTVHSHGGRQLIKMGEDRIIRLSERSKSNCLGADDAGGVWLMVEMIRAKVPGYYIFHRCEERGGKGSDYVSEQIPQVVKDKKAVIALDRKGTDSVITRQWGGRCCSDEFGKSLAAAIGLGYKLDTGGSFTDSANYVDLVGECTNLSIGYYSQHSDKENIDLLHLLALREKLVVFDESKLTYKRKPGEKEPVVHYQWRGNNRYRGGHHYDEDFFQGQPQMSRAEWRYLNMNGPDYVSERCYGGYWKDSKYVACTPTQHAARLAEVKAIVADSKKLPPKKDDKPGIGHNGGPKLQDNDPNGKPFASSTSVPSVGKTHTTVRHEFNRTSYVMKNGKAVPMTMSDFVKSNFDDVGALMEDWGFDVNTMRAMIADMKCHVTDTKKDDKVAETPAVH